MLLLWSLPTLIHLGLTRGAFATRRIHGLRPAGWWWIGWGVVIGMIGLLLGFLAFMLVPDDATAAVSPGPALGVGAMIGIAAAAAGEEIFFRGFLQGQLARWRGERFALWAQAVIFLLPHLFLLLIDARLWVLLPIQFLLGLLLGVLRQRTGSVLPGVVAHALTNVTAGLLLA